MTAMDEQAQTTRQASRPVPGPAARPRTLADLLDPRFMARLDALDILSRKILQGKLAGERRSKRRGQSVEFADHRQYAVGDDLRRLDWNIYARLDQLFVKLFLEEQDLTVDVLIDASGSTADPPGGPDALSPPKTWAIRRLAAALAYIGLVNHSRVTLSAFADGITAQLANMRGRHYVARMGELLLGAEAAGPGDFAKSCRQLAAGRVGSGVVIVISDFLFKEGYEEGLGCLLGGRNDLYVIQLLTPAELDPPLAGDLKLIDIEDGDAAEVTVNAALVAYYKRTLSAYCNQLQSFCTRRGAAYLLANAADPVEALILKHLRHRGLLR